MYKKILIVAITIACFNIHADDYHNSKFSENTDKQQNQLPARFTLAQQTALDHLNKRLQVLDGEEKDQYSHTNICWAGVIAGILMAAIGSGVKGCGGLIWPGVVIGGGSAALGSASISNENEKAKTRRDERKQITAEILKIGDRP